MAERPKPDPNPPKQNTDILSGRKELGVQIETDLVLKRTGVALRLTPEKPDDFRRAMKVLANNAEYREAATKEPTMILEDFDLSARELQALRGVARLSGADLSAIDKSVAAELLVSGGLSAADTDIDVSCCSCCCCCCGETSVVVR